MSKKKIINKEILKDAIKGAFIKLNPKFMMKNPVMFVVEIGFLITLFLTTLCVRSSFNKIRFSISEK